MIDLNDILSFKEYAAKANITQNTLWRRIHEAKLNKVVLSEFEVEEVKKIPTDRYNQELAIAIQKKEKVKLISWKKNPPTYRRGRPLHVPNSGKNES